MRPKECDNACVWPDGLCRSDLSPISSKFFLGYTSIHSLSQDGDCQRLVFCLLFLLALNFLSCVLCPSYSGFSEGPGFVKMIPCSPPSLLCHCPWVPLAPICHVLLVSYLGCVLVQSKSKQYLTNCWGEGSRRQWPYHTSKMLLTKLSDPWPFNFHNPGRSIERKQINTGTSSFIHPDFNLHKPKKFTNVQLSCDQYFHKIRYNIK